jgi:sigma-B regulation protein RsbQ
MLNIFERNNINITGHGEKVMLFAHGFGCDQSVWKDIIPAFENEYKIIVFDYVGAGKSDITAYDKIRYSMLEGYAADILDICYALHLKDIIFVGHSVSSMIGALAAIKEPGIFDKLIFAGPSPRYLNDDGYNGGYEKEDLDLLFKLMDEDYISWGNETAPAIMGNKNRPELGEELAVSFCTLNPEIARDFARVTFLSDNRDDLPHIPVESLTLQCREDILAPLDVGYFINKNTKGNTLMILNATGHCPHVSAPAETINAIKSYLSGSIVNCSN